MNLKNRKKLIILMFSMILILVVASIIIENDDHKTNSSSAINEETKNYVYNFNETLNLEIEKGLEENESIGTEISGIGIITDYYDEKDITYKDDKIYLDSFDGVKVISFSWPEKGIASSIQEPDFGTLNRVISDESYSEIAVIYKDVTIKDIDSYINLLSGLGFSNVEKKDRNKNKDYYDYIAANQDEVTVIINYSNGQLSLKLT